MKNHARRTQQATNPLPHLFHIGTQRAGSTYVFNLLKGHPGVSLYSRKESSFYNRNFCRGLAWYRSCFPSPGVPIDTSPKYFMTGEVTAPRIRSVLGSETPRFLLILRNPIDYVHSHFRFHVQHGYFHSSSEYRKVYRSLCDHVQAYPHYLARGMYWAILSDHWLSNFASDQFKIVIFEDFIRYTDRVLSDVLAFFKLPAATLSARPRDRNRLFRHRLLYALVREIKQMSDQNMVKRALKLLYRTKLYDYAYDRFLTQERRSLDRVERNRLASKFANDVSELERFLGYDILVWRDFH